MQKLLLFSLIPLFFACGTAEKPTTQKKAFNNSIDQKVDSLLSLMSIEEKAGQMTQVNITVVAKKNDASDIPVGANALDPEKLNEVLVKCNVGSILNA